MQYIDGDAKLALFMCTIAVGKFLRNQFTHQNNGER